MLKFMLNFHDACPRLENMLFFRYSWPMHVMIGHMSN